MDALQRWLTLVSLVAAALAALLYLGRLCWKGFQGVERIVYELSPNHGQSMKDELSAVARGVGEVQAELRDMAARKEAVHQLLQAQITALEAEIRTHHPLHRRERPEP